MMDVMDVSHVEADGRLVPNNVHAGERSLLPIEVCEAAGHYYQGVLAGAMKNIIFVESQRIPPVGTTVTVSLAESILNLSTKDWMEAQGTVRWICPTIDYFGFSRGFAVQIDGSRCGTSEKAVKGKTAEASAESIQVGQRIMGRLGRTWRRPLPRYEVLGVLF